MPLGAVPFPFGICRICKDKATGLHYGVATCEGCKGFFKRSISKQEKFKCYFGGSCDVNPKTRSQCKACRFRRCLETGMSVDGVRMGRIPKVEKDKVLEAFHDGGSHFSNHELVVQQTNEGNYTFELNKTNATTGFTNIAAQDTASDNTSPVALTTVKNTWSVKENAKEEAEGDVSMKTLSHVAIASVGENNKEFREIPVENYTPKNISEDLSRCDLRCPVEKETRTSQILFKEVSDKKCDEIPLFNQMATPGADIKDAVQSENCENPFNDKYFDFCSSNSKGFQQRTIQASQKILNDHSMNEQFHQVFFDRATLGYNAALTHNQEVAYSTNNNINSSQHLPDPSSAYQKSLAIKDDGCMKSAQVDSGRTSLMSTQQRKGSSEREDHNPRKRTSFSPALINVLLEQVLESQESVNVIAEKIQQKHQEGNFTELVAQNLSHRLSQMSAKRRRITDVPHRNSLTENILKHVDGSKNTGKQNDFGGLRDCKCVCSDNDKHHGCCYNDSHHGYCDFAMCRKCSSFAETMTPKYGDAYKNSKGCSVSVCNGTVSSSTMSYEEEANLKKIKNTLEGIDIAMKILNRLKPEHREKIRQFKLKKIHMRVMTDSEDDIKETYSKLISGIPNLNERILGFCNSVPGFTDFAKEDQDALMKRAYYDIWMLCYSEYIQDDECYMILESGEIYSQKAMRKILNDNMVDKIFEFATQFNSLELTDVEVAILCAARLTATDGQELSNRGKVHSLHSHLLDVLAFEVKQNHESCHARKLIDIFRLMPLLETVNRIQREIIAKFSI